MEILSLCISLLAIFGSVFTYLYHDKKIKSQEARINEYELSKIENEKTEALQAKVRANSYYSGQSKLVIRIFNSGRAKANNIRLEFLPKELHGGMQMNNFPFPFLNTGDATEISMIVFPGNRKRFEIKMQWDDEYKINNEHSQIITP